MEIVVLVGCAALRNRLSDGTIENVESLKNREGVTIEQDMEKSMVMRNRRFQFYIADIA